MTSTDLLDRLTTRGIKLRAVDDRIQAKPMSLLLPQEREQLQKFKAELLTLLQNSVDEFFAERAAIREFDAKLSERTRSTWRRVTVREG